MRTEYVVICDELVTIEKSTIICWNMLISADVATTGAHLATLSKDGKK